MDAIRIKNLRSLADTGLVELRPITLLLGRNSSGKSTFLRSFPLLRQSVESHITGPILWYGNYVDFGDFGDAVRANSSPSIISFEFQLQAPARQIGSRGRRVRQATLLARSREQASPFSYQRLNHYYQQFAEDLDLHVAVELTQGGQDGGTRVCTCNVIFAEHEVALEFDSQGKVTQFMVNSADMLEFGCNFSVLPSSFMIPVIYEETSEDEFGALIEHRRVRGSSKGSKKTSLYNVLLKELSGLLHSRTNPETREEIAFSIPVGPSHTILRAMKSIKIGGKTWSERTSQLSMMDPRFERIKDLKIALAVPLLLEYADLEVSRSARDVNYIAPVRATTERYYRPQNLAVEEIDFQGTNLAMFLRNLTETERKHFGEWTEEHLNFSVFAKSSGGHISLRVREQPSGEEYNLADVGFGLSQVLPIIAQLWATTQRHQRRRRRRESILFAIEQPELHLHPGLQAKVADLFLAAVDAARRDRQNLCLLIETHSETMVNRFGHRIAAGEVDPDDVQIVMFEREGTESSTIQFVKYDEEGFLEQWPLGFFEPELV